MSVTPSSFWVLACAALGLLAVVGFSARPMEPRENIASSVKPMSRGLRRTGCSGLTSPPRALQNCQGVAEGQIGLIKGADSALPLFATEHPSRRGRFWYHTLTDGNIPLKVGVTSNGRDCLQEIGCDELFDGDMVQVPVIGGDWVVSLYPRFPIYM